MDMVAAISGGISYGNARDGGHSYVVFNEGPSDSVSPDA